MAHAHRNDIIHLDNDNPGVEVAVAEVSIQQLMDEAEAKHSDFQNDDADLDPRDGEEVEDPLAIFGDNELITAARDPALLRELLRQGYNPYLNTLLAALQCEASYSVEILLEAGLDANTSLEVDRRPVWYPIQQATYLPPRTEDDRERQTKCIASLIRHGADPLAVFWQPRGWQIPWTWQVLALQEVEGHDLVRRSVLHAMLEDGAFVAPLLAQVENGTIDIDQRDSNGRTLFLSACKSVLGADAAVNGTLDDIIWDPFTRGYSRDPFASVVGKPTLFEWFRDHRANLSAVDLEGKNALHHLLEAHDTTTRSYRPAIIRKSLRSFLQSFPSLVNQPDQQGVYTLHSAVSRLQECVKWEGYAEFAELEEVIQDLLDVGAEPSQKNAKGSNILHMLASPDSVDEEILKMRRRMFRYFADRGVDPRAKNGIDESVAESFKQSCEDWIVQTQ